jgi:hypothetical protein
LDDISSRVFQRFDANVLALSHHMAVSTLRALVKQQTGFSLGEYVNLVRSRRPSVCFRVRTYR